ncbi:hypothetical protein [Hufsiella ginkgonis]|uniref:DUF1990 family protein n=1 Tax=Hufsiella ginkgonis TaxID=2695274 RepID=A0A7K1Y0G0_9SPHI|nr:hypothetical protein [Hufsiella ginkgonis]MXV16715.1 hypothetical protein [Hufsiella ginkgonis]
MKNTEPFIPPQYTGKQTDFADSRSFDSLTAARSCYEASALRLRTISKWHEYTGAGSATFGLTDATGNKLQREAQEGDYFSIDLPGPGPLAGNGVEWVHIEQLLTGGAAGAAEEFIVMQVRPCPDPRNSSADTAHFFAETATSTFVIARRALRVTAEIHGRNEQPNQNAGVVDKFRNTLIALFAREGASGVQWERLAHGLLNG